MKLHFWETRGWEMFYPTVIGILAAGATYLNLHQGRPIFENMQDVNMVTMVLGVIAIGFVLISTILLTQKRKMPPILKDMKRTGEYSILMAYVSRAVSSTLLLISYVSLSFFGFLTASNIYICCYAYLAVSCFFNFNRVISILLMTMKDRGKA